MFKEVITYEDFNGQEVKEAAYFNITQAEIIEMSFEVEGGLQERLQRMVDAKDAKTSMAFFKDFLLRSYGKKSDDGKRFIKNDEIRADFEASPMYDYMYMRLATDDKYAVHFIEHVAPKGMYKQALAQNAAN